MLSRASGMYSRIFQRNLQILIEEVKREELLFLYPLVDAHPGGTFVWNRGSKGEEVLGQHCPKGIAFKPHIILPFLINTLKKKKETS